MIKASFAQGLSARTMSSLGRFPKHKELFAEDYYEADGQEVNPYDTQFPGGPDTLSYDKPTHRVTSTGILSDYKKQLNLTPEDIVQKDFWERLRETRNDTERRLNDTKPEVFTKNHTMRLRLQRDLAAEMPKDGQEYGDYQKYEKNSVVQKNDQGFDDPGNDTFFTNYQNMLRRINLPEGDDVREKDHETIAQTIGNYNVHSSNMLEQFNLARDNVDLADLNDKWEAEKAMV